MLCAQGVAAPLMLSSFLLQLVRANLTSGCLITSDILSCTNLGLKKVPEKLPVMVATVDLNHNHLEHIKEGSFAGLPNLDTVRLAHNQLSKLTPGTFRNTSNIRHLDLSSNQLNIIEDHYFQELVGIKELLLYNNRIVTVESKALSGLSNLRKAYLSHNRLTDFPFFSIQQHPNLITLDLSSNRMPNLPVEAITALTEKIHRQEEEPFNTGFTTLLGCVVSLVLVLMYLYLTPCRCWCRKQPLPATPSPANECSAQSSILTPTPPATTEGSGRKVSNNKHVVFLEPIEKAQNGRPRAALALEHPKLAVTRSDADSVTSVFSDTTIVP
ncbi:amphoterin-induced 3-like isoform X1 [Labeo rohita]|uniref:Amphoterin-induced 3-like isoform X1 n=1 Tax=Labeo rohita TaxID=84645 RepID=A0A498NIR1_LABRO|nr:amphoterin-induced 3-like isoform X1 [Labeo rohita]RXN31802.1 amphoterin-induced 3-like isoform X1 [Labeo rohita]